MEGTGAAAETRVRFGTKPWQTMPLEMAELVLMNWRRRTKAAKFGDVLATVASTDEDGGR